MKRKNNFVSIFKNIKYNFKTISSLIICIIICILESCDNKTIKEVVLKENINIDEFSDSTFFSDIRSICFSDSLYYATDYSRDQVFVLDKNFKLIRTLGNKGQGPGEFLGAGHLNINNDSVFVINDMKKTFEIFNNLEHIGTVTYADGTRPNSNYRFFEYNGCLFYNPSVSQYSICKYNFNSKKVDFFGNIIKYNTAKETRIKNHRHILRYNNRIIAVPDCQPIIEVYDFEGKFLNSVDFSNLKPVAEMLKFILGTEQKENTYYGFNKDVVVYKNSLYILILTAGIDNKPKSNSILEFKIVGNNFVPSNLYHLGDGYFNTINVSEQGIETYNTRMNQLKRYKYETK